jgi:hypothetical protein
MELTEAVLRFTWTYEDLPDGRTRLNQHIALEGPGAEAYVREKLGLARILIWRL